MKQTEIKYSLDAWTLKCFAMFVMVIDHIGYALLPQHTILRVIGRFAFPIFAFFIAEGYRNTKNVKRYILRMGLFAIISEIPFNLMMSARFFAPKDQNVLFTFLIALCVIYGADLLKEQGINTVFVVVLTSVFGYCVGELLKTDYAGPGVLTVLIFYYCYGQKNEKLLVFVSMLIINAVLIPSAKVSNTLGSFYFKIPVQAAGVLALFLIWQYHGDRGPYTRFKQLAGYAFYPLQCLLVGVAAMILK